MIVSFYLRSGSVISCESDSTPEVSYNQFTGTLISYNLPTIKGKIKPIYIDPSEIVAVTVEITETNDSF